MTTYYPRLINKVLNTLRLQDASKSKYASSPLDSQLQFRHPFITISREPGSGGQPIAKLLAKKLDYTYYNKKLLDKISKSTKLKGRVLKNIDEKGRTAVQDFVQSLINPDYVSDLKYIREAARIILSVGYNGKAVILGRGANFILPRGRGLRVRIMAPYKVRVQRAMEYEMKTYEQARETISKIEKDRAEFVSQYFNKDVANSKYYDLVLNTEFIGLDEAVDIIACNFSKKFPRHFRCKLS